MKNFYTNVSTKGDKILFRGVVNGQRVQKKIQGYSPKLYVPSEKDEEWKSIKGKNLAEIEPGSIKETKDFIKNYSGVDNFEIHGDIDIAFQWISDTYPEQIDYDLNLIRIFNLDIEVYSPDGFPDAIKVEQEVTAVTLFDSLTQTYQVFGYVDFVPHLPNIVYHKSGSEREMLLDLLDYWEKNYPDIVTGWYVRFFDMEYLINRLAKLFGMEVAQRLSPWGNVYRRTFQFQGEVTETYELTGLVVYDGIELYKKYAPTKQESYKLGFIAKAEELPIQKMTYEGSLADLFKNNPQKYFEYNVADVAVVEALLKKHNFINIALYICYLAKVNYATVYSPVATWDAFAYNWFKQQKIAIPPKRDIGGSEQFEGAFVKEPVPGKYKWVVNVDAESLYPSVARQWNIGPNTLIETNRNTIPFEKMTGLIPLGDLGDMTMTANNQYFRKDIKSVFAALFEILLDGRKIDKKAKIECEQLYEKQPSEELKQKIAALDNAQMAKKIFANSGYGVMGNAAFRYFDIRLAEAITVTGKLVILLGEIYINVYLNKVLKTNDVNYVLMIDTDALYIHFHPIIKMMGMENDSPKKIVDFLDKLCKQHIQPELDRCYKKLFEYMNCYEQRIWLKRECIADSVVIAKKKRYAMNIWDKEGVRYEKPKVKVTGFESVRSSTPEYCRKKIKDAIEIILTKEETDLQDYVAKIEADFMKQSPDTIATPMGVSDLTKYKDSKTIYRKGSPMHVKGSLLFNAHIKKLGLDKKYQEIKDGDKIKFSYIKKPNPLQDSVLAWPDTLPEEFNFSQYIDYEAQFEKTFIGPIRNITDRINWNITKNSSLFDFTDEKPEEFTPTKTVNIVTHREKDSSLSEFFV